MADRMQSLETFFSGADDVTLNNCDREAIHRSGAIQNEAVFIALDRTDLTVSYWSANVDRLGIDPEQLAKAPVCLRDVLADTADEIEALAYEGVDDHQHIELLEGYEANHLIHDVVVCFAESLVFVEFLPTGGITPSHLKVKLRETQRASASIGRADSFEAALDLAATAVKNLTGFDRVKVYKFLPDGSGAVVAEALEQHMPSYAGLHFPVTDIPKQARELYRLVPFRATLATRDDGVPIVGPEGAVDGDLDLTWSLTRSVSIMHTAYLRNMGIAGALTITLTDRGKVWGLLSCHHSDPIAIPFELWGLAFDIGETLMSKLMSTRENLISEKINEMRSLEARVAANLRDAGVIEQVLTDFSPTLMRFMEADGFAFQFDGKVYSVGEAPPAEFTRRLIEWINNDKGPSKDEYYQTHRLHHEWPEARLQMETACGVLVQPVIIHRVCQLVWFRGPVTKTVNWAGDPNAKSADIDPNGLHILEPRNSFKTWVEEHREEALPWTEAEIAAAEAIFREVLDIIASQAQSLKRLTNELTLSQEETREELSQFAYAAAHDIQNPINTITNALELMRSVQGEQLDPIVEKSMDYAVRSSERLRHLADQMANFVALGRREIEPEPVDLTKVLSDVSAMLDHLIRDNDVHLSIDPLPNVPGSQDLLTILFLNLISNAIKYRKKDTAPVITINTVTSERFVRVSVSDNGIGIEPENADRIFNAFDRLHRADEIAGSGLGLATCKRIAELHKATLNLDSDYSEGARFILELRRRPWTTPTLN